MNLRTLAQACRNNLCSAQCRFWSDVDNDIKRDYTFLLTAQQAEALKPGDWVTVMTATRDGVKIVRVESISTDPDLDLELEKGYRWVGQKIDIGIFAQREREDKALYEALMRARRTSAREQALRALGIDPNIIMLEAKQ